MASKARLFARIMVIVVAAWTVSEPAGVPAQSREFSASDRDALRRAQAIRLDLNVSRWRGRADASDLDPRNDFSYYLQEAGFTIVPPGDAAYDAVVRVAYVEAEKPGYGLVPGAGSGGLSGTTITCDVELVHRQLGQILQFRITGSTPYSVPFGSLHSSAEHEFRRHVGYLLFGPRVARALGTRSDFPRTTGRLHNMLRSGDQEDRAAAALALGELKSASSVSPLTALLVTAEPPHVIRIAIDALVQIGDLHALPGLQRFAAETSDSDMREAVLRAIETLRRK